MTVRFHGYSWSTLVANVLGAGSYGFVYGGAHEASGCRVAVKMFNRAEDYEKEHRMHVKALSGLNDSSPCLPFPRLYDVCENSATPAMIMALYDKDARSCIVKGPIVDEDCRAIIRQVAAALQHLHSNCGMVHLDVKTRNILYNTRTRNAALADFSLAEPIRGAPSSPTYFSLNYRPPEMCGVRATRDMLVPGADLWAFGCVVWELACHERLFEGRTEAEISTRISMFIRVARSLAKLNRAGQWSSLVKSLCRSTPNERRLQELAALM